METMKRPPLFLYSDLGTTNGATLVGWSPNVDAFRKSTGADWGIRVANCKDKKYLKMLPHGYVPQGDLAFDAAFYVRNRNPL